jgi:hypothetical protein
MQFLRSVCYNSFQIPLCSIRFLPTCKVSKSYSTLRYFFSQPPFSEFPILELYRKLLLSQATHSANILCFNLSLNSASNSALTNETAKLDYHITY